MQVLWQPSFYCCYSVHDEYNVNMDVDHIIHMTLARIQHDQMCSIGRRNWLVLRKDTNKVLILVCGNFENMPGI